MINPERPTVQDMSKHAKTIQNMSNYVKLRLADVSGLGMHRGLQITNTPSWHPVVHTRQGAQFIPSIAKNHSPRLRVAAPLDVSRQELHQEFSVRLHVDPAIGHSENCQLLPKDPGLRWFRRLGDHHTCLTLINHNPS